MMPATPAPHTLRSRRRLWLTYAGCCLLTWTLFVLAGSEFDRGLDPFWLAVYQATTMLWAPMLLGVAVWPVAHRLHTSDAGPLPTAMAHLLAALGFAVCWQAGEFAVNALLFGMDHAGAVLVAGLLWRSIWGLVAYAVIATAFTAVLQARAARTAAVAAAQAESALAKAELSAISGKLNPHFLFNTLNTLIALTRKDPAGAEAALLQFASMLRYVLDTKRGAEDRVMLCDEIDFLRDYLALEALRLGPRLRVDWQLEERVMADELPPLTLQPLVENSILHAVAPRKTGGCVTISARRNALNQGLELAVSDDGPGCDPAALEARPGQRRGVGLSALKKRFALDYGGQARLRIHTAPGTGFRVDLFIPQA
ncbi:sensor histidine kinase [Roseateles cellulosilyticus]|uniref:Histidine kinase n=1 Tax=Pelomonas cellulosilytica TaxID=2906762 RepID=A0ABS8XUR2_9BURK|nr:histidine kinase [Pelomonas sp. P8]MCE4555487.1 histidine kinase [Pelomonas sp. P8]